MKTSFKFLALFLSTAFLMVSCGKNGDSNNKSALNSSNAEKVYVAPGEHDSHYAFISGGYSGNLTVYRLWIFRRNKTNVKYFIWYGSLG